MTYDPDKHHRRSIRLRTYDYTSPGAYFITLCTYEKQCLFGEVKQGRTIPNGYGRIVLEEWQQTAVGRPNVHLGAFVVMPNHVYGIIEIVEPCRGKARLAPTAAHPRAFGKPVTGSLPTIVGAFKSAVTKHINRRRRTPGSMVWQRGYYERVIRNDRERHAIEQYIVENPLQWHLDRYHPSQHW